MAQRVVHLYEPLKMGRAVVDFTACGRHLQTVMWASEGLADVTCKACIKVQPLRRLGGREMSERKLTQAEQKAWNAFLKWMQAEDTDAGATSGVLDAVRSASYNAGAVDTLAKMREAIRTTKGRAVAISQRTDGTVDFTFERKGVKTQKVLWEPELLLALTVIELEME